MKNVLIAGSNGMIGKLILEKCFSDDRIGKITTIVRRKSGISHPKLVEVIHDDFLDFSKIQEHFVNQDICFYCIGVYTGQVSPAEFAKITIDFTKVFGQFLFENSNNVTFCFLSGQGADRSEKSSVMFAKDKGIAENILLKTHFKQLYIFRPGYIYPVNKRIEPNLMYKTLRLLYKPFLNVFFSKMSCTSEMLSTAMFDVAINDNKKNTFENIDIRNYKIIKA